MKPFGATGDPRTCLWCGGKLRPSYALCLRPDNPDGSAGGITTDRSQIDGYGYHGSNCFCSKDCACWFGHAAAKKGFRLRRSKPTGHGGA